MLEFMLLMGGTPEAGAEPPAFSFLVPILAIIAIYYFLLIRPQQRQASQHQKLLDGLKKGDTVVTDSGLVGTVQSIQDQYVVLKADDNVKLKFLKSKIATTAAAIEASATKQEKK